VADNELARIYASSLLEIAKEKKRFSEIEVELKTVSDLVKDDKDLSKFLASPSISKNDKLALIKKVFEKNLSEEIVNFLCVLVEKDRQEHIEDIFFSLSNMIDDEMNRLRVTVISNDKIDSTLSGKIASKLKEAFKKDVIVKEEIDESILGGIIIKAGDLVIDGSLIKDLKNIRYNLLNCKVRSDLAYED
jgi:F-type H+-transporting ATPase subunit delta